ncbi:MAG TPA: hypothetical protein VJG90_01540 [Candidatus Nanoarchaeia archaeon]|nr:hypothetical protein [Candidatus Nanoarchaeia archaeon]
MPLTSSKSNDNNASIHPNPPNDQKTKRNQTLKIHKIFKAPHHSKGMKKKMSEKEWEHMVKEAKADPKVMKEIDRFIKATTSTSF